MKAPETPYFVLDEKKVRASVASIRAAFARHWFNSILSFSVKTNSWVALQRILSEEDVWAEVVSESEYDLAMQCGFRRGSLICNGASKSPEYIRRAVFDGAVIHLDSLSEVEELFRQVGTGPVAFGVRINATEPDFDAEPLSGPLGSRFGLSVRDGDMDRLVEILKMHPNAKLVSLHLHCNTRDRGIRGFVWLTHFFARTVSRFSLDDVTTFDIGGSFGHDFDHPGAGAGRWPSWDEYMAAISATLRECGFCPERLRLAVEPGSGLISGCADYYTRVVGERIFNGVRVLQIDGSRIHLDPHFARAGFNANITTPYLAGSTCLEKDRIACDSVNVGARVGDLICFSKTGAYTYGLSPIAFIHKAPAVWLRRLDGELVCSLQPEGGWTHGIRVDK